MHEITRLVAAINKLSTCKSMERKPLEKEVLLWGSRLHTRVQEMYALLDKQLTWLDANADAPTYERRFSEWTDLLAEYGKACNALADAKGIAA